MIWEKGEEEVRGTEDESYVELWRSPSLSLSLFRACANGPRGSGPPLPNSKQHKHQRHGLLLLPQR